MSTVTVGCKIRAGLIMELIEPGRDDSGKIGIAPAAVDPDHVRVFLKGPNSNRIAAVNPLTDVFVLTEVEESLAREWFKRHAKSAFVRNGQVFLQEKPKSALGESKDRVDVKTGFEPLDPAGDPRTGGAKPDKDSMPTLKRMGVL